MKPEKRAIKISWSTIDHAHESRTFATLEGARKYCHRKVGATPEIGLTYAIDAFGVSKIVVRSGSTLAEIFPDTVSGNEEYDRGPYSRWE